MAIWWLPITYGTEMRRKPHIRLLSRYYTALHTHTHTHTHTHLTALFPGLPGWAGTRKVKPIWILLKQETVSGSGISGAICKTAPRSRQITMPKPYHSVFYRPDALPAAQPTVSKHWRQFKASSPMPKLPIPRMSDASTNSDLPPLPEHARLLPSNIRILLLPFSTSCRATNTGNVLHLYHTCLQQCIHCRAILAKLAELKQNSFWKLQN